MIFPKLSLIILILITAVSPFARAGAEEIRLEGVVQDQADPSKSLAIVNGDPHKIGETVGTGTIKEIGSNYVKLFDSKTGTETTLQVKEAVKPPASASQEPAAGPAPTTPASLVNAAKKYLSHPEQAVNRLWELQALRDLAIINNASVKYFEKNDFFPVRLRQLTLDGFLPVSYESGKTNQYQFYLSNTPQKPDDFQLHADPLNPEAGLRYFFVGPDALIRESTGKPADIKSPLHNYIKKQ